MAADEPDHITRDDIESKLKEIRGHVDSTAQAAKAPVMAAAAVVAVLVIGTAYLIGRRRGKKRSTIVEIRRV